VLIRRTTRVGVELVGSLLPRGGTDKLQAKEGIAAATLAEREQRRNYSGTYRATSAPAGIQPSLMCKPPPPGCVRLVVDQASTRKLKRIRLVPEYVGGAGRAHRPRSTSSSKKSRSRRNPC
jgi:hypothetical protein